MLVPGRRDGRRSRPQRRRRSLRGRSSGCDWGSFHAFHDATEDILVGHRRAHLIARHAHRRDDGRLLQRDGERRGARAVVVKRRRLALVEGVADLHSGLSREHVHCQLFPRAVPALRHDDGSAELRHLLHVGPQPAHLLVLRRRRAHAAFQPLELVWRSALLQHLANIRHRAGGRSGKRVEESENVVELARRRAVERGGQLLDGLLLGELCFVEQVPERSLLSAGVVCLALRAFQLLTRHRVLELLLERVHLLHHGLHQLLHPLLILFQLLRPLLCSLGLVLCSLEVLLGYEERLLRRAGLQLPAQVCLVLL
mmetsp:Transcript_46032/g.94170  ORF Transcript_46032/g.94170 Transcript_46032/m.94170 type:complete len:312 (+) Transcript_46032:1028-1963(+)